MSHEDYREGFHARMAGKDPTLACPHPYWTEKWFDWMDGWKDQDEHLRNRDEALKSIGIR